MDTRYQVFVSSTYTDLKEERKAIIETLLNAKYIPAGMEMFSASNDEQFKYIKKIIDNCDYYVLIIGARYGSINPTTGISFTEQEYDYAVLKKIPVLAFLHSNPEDLPVEKRDDMKDQLDKFCYKVSQNRLCKMWDNKSDLVSSVVVSLIYEISENPQLGWTRGSSLDSTELLLQINDLRMEKVKLEKEIAKLKDTINIDANKVENLASGKDIFKVIGCDHLSSYTDYTLYADLTWDDIFSAVGPYAVAAKNYSNFKIDLKNGINSAFNKNFYEINDNCAQTIKIQLNALGLINVNSNIALGGGLFEFISITQKGNEYLLFIKSIKKGEQ